MFVCVGTFSAIISRVSFFGQVQTGSSLEYFFSLLLSAQSLRDRLDGHFRHGWYHPLVKRYFTRLHDL